MHILLYLVLLCTFAFSQELFKPLPTTVKYDENIVNLGRELFFDTALSKAGDVSCATCHGNYGVDNKKTSIGTQARQGFMNAPSVFNLNYHIDYFWNGRSRILQDQIVNGPLINKHEMDNDEATIMKRLSHSKKYIDLFQKAYAQKPTYSKMLDAIAEFEKTLITPNSKFDKFLRGESALSEKEQQGFELFKSYGCASCHNGINIGSNSYQKFGSVIPYNDNKKGKWDDRYQVTKSQSDKNVYKVPSLRNVEKTAPYFHDGSVASLKEAIRLMAYNNLGIMLEDDEIESIEAFLGTLTGEIPETYGLK